MNTIKSAVFGISVAVSFVCASSAMAGGGPSAPEAIDGVHGKCAPTRMGYRTSTDTQVTDSSQNVRLPGTKVAFTQKSDKPKCVIVTFSGQPQAESGRQIYIEARIDGVTCSPDQVQFGSNTTYPYFNAHTYKFVCPGIAPGKHVADIKWRRGSSNGYVYMARHTMMVEFY